MATHENYEVSIERDITEENEISNYHLIVGAILDGNLELINHLFTQRNSFNFKNLDENGNSLMHIAVISKHLEIVRYLAEHNVPLYTVNKDGETPLHIAAKFGLLPIVDYIIDVGSNLLKFVDKNGNTPLHLACLTKHPDVALSLCNADGPLEVRNKDRKTPLLCAVISSSESCVRVLLLAGARVDITDEEGNTALHLAAIQGDYLIVKLLSKAVSNVDIFNILEFTPLHLAAKNGHLRTVRCLILAGADPSITSRNGITPDVMAYAQGHSKVGMLLTKMKPEKRTAWIEQLRQGTHRMPRIKLKLFGSSLVGKTQLTHSLYTGPISAYLKKKLTDFAGLTGEVSPKSSVYRHNYPYLWDIEAQHENYTHGIDVHITNEYTLWDFSGFPSYYCFYDHFIGDIDSIHLVLFNLMDSLEWRRRSVRFWLDFLHARIPVKGPLLFGGRPTEMARVILIGTHADVAQCQKDQNGFYYDEETLLFLKEIILEYQDKLDIHESIYLLDARDGTSLEMKQLKTYLTDVRNIIIQTLPRTNSLMIDLSNKLPEWTVNDIFPVCNLDEFAERVHEHINPLCTDEHLVTLVEHLQCAGNILYIQTTSHNTTVNNSSAVISEDNGKYYYYKDDLIVLNPNHLCNEILEIQIEMPRLNQIPLYHGLWDNSNDENKRMIYSGLQLITSPGQFIHLMPRIQVQLRREISINRKKFIQTKLSNEFNKLNLKGHHNSNQNINKQFYTTSELYLNSLDFNFNNNNIITNSIYNKRRTKGSHSWNLVQWLHGSKITDSKGEIQIFLCINEYKQVLDIFSRCLPCHIHQAFSLLHETVHLITQVISKCCPNLDLEFKLLNSNDLSKHYKNPKVWDSKQLIQTLLFLIAQNSHSYRTSLCSIDLHKPRTSQNETNQRSTDVRHLLDNDDDDDDDNDVNIGKDEGEEEDNDDASYEENIFNNNNINNTNIKRRENRKSDHSIHLQNQLKKDLFFSNNELAQEVSNHLLNIPSYPLPTTVLQKLAKQIDVNERDPYKFNTLVQCLCYPEMISLITQWNQGICLWSTLSPTVILLHFASKYPIRFLEWALLSSYDVTVCIEEVKDYAVKPLFYMYISN
uniref:Death-associated protein kinase 1 n=1 Tax=Schistosoma haematobium TaxID=6185 RepID=A0A094ZQX6_SCHHA